MCKAQCLEGTIKLNKLWPVASNKLIFDFLFNIIGGIAFIYFYLFIFKFYFWLCWVFIAVHRLSLVAASGGCSSLPCVGFSLWWLLLLWSTGSRAWAQQLWRRGLVAPWLVGSSRTRARTRVPCIGRRILNHCATKEARDSF